MKIYVNNCGHCHNKIYLNNIAYSRAVLRRQLGADIFFVRCGTCGFENQYSVSEVYAEKEQNAAVAGTVIGGLMGLLGGPLGLVIGAGLGAAVGGANDTEETQKVINFNNSW